MAVYDLAHRLAKEIKKSTEYSTYTTLRQKVVGNEKTKDMLLDFQKQQMKLQAKQFSGEELSEKEIEQLNKLREIIGLNKNIQQYLDAEYRMSVLLNDIQRILFSDLEIGIEEESDNEEDQEKHPEK